MKRVLFVTALMLFGMAAAAQDVITTKDGDDIQAKVIEITETDVMYKKYSNLNGPTYILSKSDILIVRYENGEKEVFRETSKANAYKPNTTHEVTPGMRYAQYKDFYDKSMYVAQPGDPYSPSWAGIASFLIPGLGQAVDGQWGSGTLFFLANFGLGVGSAITYYGMMNYREPYKTNNTKYFIAITVARLAIDVWSIADAVKVAKIKNMYNQDLRGQRTAQLDYSVTPFVTAAPDMGNGAFALTGLSLTLSF